MLELISILLEREYQFEVVTGYDGLNSDGQLNYHLHMHLGNEERRIYNDDEARELLDEIKMHW